MASATAAVAATATATAGTQADSKVTVVDGPIICPGHSRPVVGLSFSRMVEDRYFLVSACMDGAPMLRDGQSGDWIGTFVGHKGAVWSCQLDSKAELAVTGSADRSVKLWDALTGAEKHSWEQKNVIKTAVFSNDTKRIYAGGFDAMVYVYDLADPSKEPSSFEHGLNLQVSQALTVPDENYLVTLCRGAGVKLWDLRSFSLARTLLSDKKTSSMSISSNGNVISVAAGTTIHFIDALNFAAITNFKMESPVECVAYHTDVDKFVVGHSEQLHVSVHSYQTGKELARLRGHHGPARCIEIAPTAQSFASGSEDGTIRIWDWPSDNSSNSNNSNSS